MKEIKPDMTCFPFRRKKSSTMLTLLFMALIISAAVYLWSINCIISIIFILFYILVNVFQSYCCAYQDCPYIGGFCPALFGMYPANFIAKIFFAGKIKKSKLLFDLFAFLGTLCGIGLFFFPVFWIAKVNILVAVLYPLLMIVYLIVLFLTMCTVCSVKNTCPGGKTSGILYKLCGF